MKYFKALAFLTAALAALPVTSYAQSGYVSKSVNLRAGPAKEYPVVAILQAGTPISVEGCLSDYRWCDVIAGPNRGWIYAGNIVYPYQGANVPVLGYGAVIGIGIVAFSIASYWDHHYRGRSWYAQRQHWINRPGPGFAPGGHRPPPGSGLAPGAHPLPRPGPGEAPGVHRPPRPGPGGPPGTHPPARAEPGRAPGDHPAPKAREPGGGHRPPKDQGPGAR